MTQYTLYVIHFFEKLPFANTNKTSKIKNTFQSHCQKFYAVEKGIRIQGVDLHLN